MKKILILFSCVFSAIAANAQDVLVMMDASEVNVKVLTVGSNEIEYKKFDDQQGPTYRIPRSEVFIIKYENGTQEKITDFEAKQSVSVVSKPADQRYAFIEQAKEESKGDIHKKNLYLTAQTYIGMAASKNKNYDLFYAGLDTGLDVILDYFPNVKASHGIAGSLGYNYKLYEISDLKASVKNLDIHCGYSLRSDDEGFYLRASLFLNIPLDTNLITGTGKVDGEANTLIGADLDLGWDFNWLTIGGRVGTSFNSQFDMGIYNRVPYYRFFIGVLF